MPENIVITPLDLVTLALAAFCFLITLTSCIILLREAKHAALSQEAVSLVNTFTRNAMLISLVALAGTWGLAMYQQPGFIGALTDKISQRSTAVGDGASADTTASRSAPPSETQPIRSNDNEAGDQEPAIEQEAMAQLNANAASDDDSPDANATAADENANDSTPNAAATAGETASEPDLATGQQVSLAAVQPPTTQAAPCSDFTNTIADIQLAIPTFGGSTVNTLMPFNEKKRSLNRSLQCALTALEYYSGPIDGDAVTTTNALKKYQREKGFRTTGYLGSSTLRRMLNDYSAKNE